MDPHLAVTTCEQALRQLVTAVLSARDGIEWLEKNFTEEQLVVWRRKQNDEQLARGRRGHAEAASSLLHYSELRELRSVIIDQWSRGFSLAFNKLKPEELKVLLLRFEDLRIPQAHSRELLPFEKDLVSGIAGDIRNRVTIYMSSQDPAGEYWPRVESVTDSFGKSASNPGEAVNSIQTGLTLRPGDVVTYTCRATDPQGRELVWYFERHGHTTEPVSGADVEMRWEVSENDVGDDIHNHLLMKVKDATWHRLGPNRPDAQVSFMYRVLPPSP